MASRLARGIARELVDLVTAIQGHASLVLEDLADDPRTRRSAEAVLAKPFGMDTLVRRVRTIIDERAARTDIPGPAPGTRWELDGQPFAELEARPGA